MSMSGLGLRDIGVVGRAAAGARIQAPALVDHHVLEARARREVDVLLDGRHVGAALVRRRQIGTRPPVPRRLARLDPRRVERRIRIQIADEIGLDEIAELVAQHDHAPRRARAIRADGSARDQRPVVEPARNARLHARLAVAAPAEIQAAVVAQVRLADGERVLRRAAHQRQVVVVVLANAARLDRDRTRPRGWNRRGRC